MAGSILIRATQVILFLLVAASGILALYSATNAVSVYSNYDVFVSGVGCVLIAAAVMPLFFFIAVYGFVHYLDFTVGHAVVICAPVLIAWIASAGRLLWTSLAPRPAIN